MKINENQVIEGLSALISQSLCIMQNERWHPGPDPDMMDSIIKFHEARANALRDIRTRCEDLFAESEAAR